MARGEFLELRSCTCGAAFQPRRITTRYCSRACMQADYKVRADFRGPVRCAQLEKARAVRAILNGLGR